MLLPLSLGAAVTIEVDGYRGDCLVQVGQAPVALSGEPPIQAKVVLGAPVTCAPVTLQVQGPGTVTSPDAPSVHCGPDGQCVYWLDANRTYTFTATPSAGDFYVSWLLDGVDNGGCDGQLKCALGLPATGHQVTAVFSPLCDRQLALSPVTLTGLPAGAALRAVWGIAGQEAWAVGDQGAVARFRGTTGAWDVVTLKDKGNGQPITDTLTGVWGVGVPAALFVVGHGTAMGSAHMLQGPALEAGTGTVAITATASQMLPAPQLAVAGFDLMNVWAVGNGGSAQKWNSTTLKFEPPAVTGMAPTTDFNGAWVSPDAAHTLWTVADKSQLFSFTGSAWTPIQAAGTNVKLLGVAGTSDELYAVGGQSSGVRHSLGSSAQPTVRKLATGADGNRTLSSVWAGSGYVFAVGDGGAVFCSRTSGTYWTRLVVTGLPTANFLGVYGSSNRLWVVGQNGTAGVLVEGTLP